MNEMEKFIESIDPQKMSTIAIVGAGASVASGLRTFRGEDGYYKGKFPEELASRSGFSKDPQLVWEWYKMRIETVLKAQPNPIHYSLAKLEEAGILDLVITQNVDGLHGRAGQKKVVEVHGTILKTHCLNHCGVTMIITEPPEVIPVKCSCGSYQRPSVVWFGESLNSDNLTMVQDKLLDCDLVLIIGTSGNVFPVASFPVIAKRYNDAKLIEFNPMETAFHQIDDLFIKGPAEKNLPIFTDLLIRKNMQN